MKIFILILFTIKPLYGWETFLQVNADQMKALCLFAEREYCL